MFAFKERDKTIPMIQMVIFGTLVVATPFVVVVRYLQGAVHDISHLMWSPFGIEIPIVASFVVAGLIGFLIWQRKKINKVSVSACLVIIAMIALAQNVQDLYGDMSLYDLQRNWHYIAYGGFSFFFFQAFYARGMSKAHMIFYSFVCAIGMSVFDEYFQFFMSNRIFDISDIAKDSYGSIIGLILVLFVAQTWGTVHLSEHTLWQKKIKDYINNPLGALTVTGTFSLTAVLFSPLLTDDRHAPILISTIFAVTLFVLLIIHLLQFPRIRIAIISVAALCLLLLSGSFLMHRNSYINYAKDGLIIYKGLPVVAWDLMIYPSGFPRLVDKKHFFNGQDKQFFLKQKDIDILLFGSGYEGNGAKGFKSDIGTFFIYNEHLNQATQVIILKTQDAVKVYNRLKKEGKRVLFVIHSNC